MSSLANICVNALTFQEKWCIPRIHSFSECWSLHCCSLKKKKKVGSVERTSSSSQLGLAPPCPFLPGCSGFPQVVFPLPRAVSFFIPRSTIVSLTRPAWSLSSEASNPICQDTIVCFSSCLTAFSSVPKRLGNFLNFFHVQVGFV